ncbi:MAG: tRNA (adenosine(37)-N6)-threonylcarbamoyltransferase complex transferase subunit TsaD [Patescibacteria group bacterium]
MKILSVETSCDETAVAVLECEGGLENATFTILGNSLYSQAALHAPYGGVYPNLAKREHQGNLAPLATGALTAAGMVHSPQTPPTIDESVFKKIRDEGFKTEIRKFLEVTEKPDIELIAVTRGPGLEPALWTGITFAESIGAAWNIPVIGIDHMEGHIVSTLLTKKSESEFSISGFELPLLALLISGGHTEFVLMKDVFSYTHVGATKDDAVGEAFDKVARLLNFPYPGGPQIAEAAARARARGESSGITFPRPMAHDDTCDFSFSGLKTAVLYKLREMEHLSEQNKEDVAEAFENAARDVIILKARRALEATTPKVFAVGGGVSANVEIRNALTELTAEEFPNVSIRFPDKTLTGDNAIMIAVAGYLRHKTGAKTVSDLSALGNLKLAE